MTRELHGLASFAGAHLGADGSIEVRVAQPSKDMPAGILEAAPPLVSAGSDVTWGGVVVGLALSDARWIEGGVQGPGQYVTALTFEPLRRVLRESIDDVGLAVVATCETVRVSGTDVLTRLVECSLAVLVRPGRADAVQQIVEAARASQKGTAMGVYEDLEAGFVKLGLTEAGARHAAGGRASRPVGLSEMGDRARPVPIGAGVTAVPARPVPVASPGLPAAPVVSGLGESALEAGFRELGLSEAAAKHAAAGR